MGNPNRSERREDVPPARCLLANEDVLHGGTTDIILLRWGPQRHQVTKKVSLCLRVFVAKNRMHFRPIMKHFFRATCVLAICLISACGGTEEVDEPTVKRARLETVGATEAYVPMLEGPLRILSATPSGSMQGMADDQRVAVTFSQPMVPLGETTTPEGALTVEADVHPTSRSIPGTLRWEGTQTLVFQPETPLPLATTFSARLEGGLEALSGDRLDSAYVWTFETPRPTITTSEPARGAPFVDPEQPLRLSFDQPIDTSVATAMVRLRTSEAEEQVPADVRAQGDSALVITPAEPLAKGTGYEVVVAAGLPSAAGPLGMAEETVVPFRTYPALRLESITQHYIAPGQPINPARGFTMNFATPVRFGDLREALSFEPAIELPPGIEARDASVGTSHVLPVEMAPETRYTVSVRGLTDTFGQTLEEGQVLFRTKAYEPSLKMKEGLLVMEATEQAAIPLHATNIDSVGISLRRLSEDEVVPGVVAYGNRYFSESESTATALTIPAGRTVPLRLTRNRTATAPLRLDSLLQGETGTVGVQVVRRRSDDTQQTLTALAQITRLGLTAKFSPHQNLVFVTDLETAQPVEGAAVTVRDAANRVLWQGETDGEGRATTPGWGALGLQQPDPWSSPTQYVTVEKDGDLAFTSSQYNDGLEPHRFDVQYDWNPEPRTFAGSVFTDRGLYKAGETVHLKAILRQKTDSDWTSVTDSVQVQVQSPRDQVVFEGHFEPSDLGTFHFDWDAPETADQGVYSVRIGLASDTTFAERASYEQGDLAQGSFRVDAFRRATFAVTARTSAESYVAGDFFEGSISGRYLFGAAMQEQPVRYTLRRSYGYYAPPGYSGYRFGGVGYSYEYGLNQTITQADTVLDADGTATIRAQVPGNEAGMPTRLVWSGSVTDPARQEIADQATATLHPGLFYIGLKPTTSFLDLGETQTMGVDVITVDPSGESMGTDVQVDVVRVQWNSVREVGADGRLRWRSERTEEVVATRPVTTVEGEASRLLVPITQGGSYRIRASARDLRGNLIRSETYFYATGTGYVAWQRADDDRVELVAERDRYAPGETARILVQSPYEEATALITVEREGILSSRVETLVGSAPQIEIPLGEEHLPNVFVGVILLNGRTPHQVRGRLSAPDSTGDAGAPGFKMGYASLTVDPGARHLRVEVTPEKASYRPGEEVTVDLRLLDEDGDGVEGEIVFSAADAGVLDLLQYALPDPFDVFYGPRPLGVLTSETRANLIEQRSFGQKEEDLIGGGGGDDAGMLREDFRPLAHWAPAIRTDGRGRAQVTFRFPESLTTFRLMAAALTGDHRFGQGQTDVLVTQPLVLQPALPRFARLEDDFEAGVLVTNTTGESGEATITAEGSGGLTLIGPAEQTVFLADGATKEVRFRWSADSARTAYLQFRAQLGKERDAFATTLDVQRPVTKEATATFASTDATAEEALRLPPDVVADLGGLEVQLSSTALVGLDGAVEYLFDYPYGCLEQRTSRVRPLLVAGDVLEAFDLEALEGNREAITEDWLGRLREYWIGDGFSLWAGGRYRNPYVSAYVVLAIAEAEAAGYAVPNDLTQQAVGALEQQVRRRSERPDYYTADVWSDTRALMLYALARHGRVLEGEIDALAQQQSDLSVDGTSYLLRTIALAGRPSLDVFKAELIQELERRVRVEAQSAYLTAGEEAGSGWIFRSDTRATAFGLTALIEAGAATDVQPIAQRMVRYLMQARQGGHWASTQENTAVVEAFHAYFEAFEEDEPDFTADVRVAGQEVLRSTFQGRSLRVAKDRVAIAQLPQGETVPIEIEKEGVGPVYYAVQLETYSTAPLEAASKGLSVARTLQRLDDRGRPSGDVLTTGNGAITLEPGALVRVTLRLSSPADRNYVVVDDALPAGLEALNAAFETTDQEALQNADAGQDRWWGSFNHTEIRDRRVLLFADFLRAGEHTYTYVARAMTPGLFVHPPAQAELMYEPSTSGRTSTGTLVVEETSTASR